jgi:hypothetical protein
MMTVKTPVSGFAGTVAGVTFTKGVGETDDLVALAYFARHGYVIEAKASAPKKGRPAAPKE